MAELTLDVARRILDVALAKGAEKKLKPLVVTVLDARGCVKISAAQDGTSLLRSEIAHGKAYGALAMGMGSRALFQRAQEQAYFIDAVNTLAQGRMVPVPGGVLIQDGGVLLGAVGVSGDTSDNDEICAIAGIEAAGLKANAGFVRPVAPWTMTRDSQRVTDATQPTNIQPVVAMFCTRGMEPFLSNAIQGMLRAGIDLGQILVGCPDNALGSVQRVTDLYSDRIQIISTQKLSENEEELQGYSGFGSSSFNDISWKKIYFIRQLIEIHPHVIYADLDIGWIRNPLHYLSEVAMTYPMAFQTEGLARFPPALCCGVASFARSERTVAFLDALIEFNAGQVDSEKRLDDQAACQRLIENDLTWLRDIYCLPETLFLNGLGYRNLQNAGERPCAMEGDLLPFLFHANWTIGYENKRKLLVSTGTWLLDDIAPKSS